MMFIHHDGCLIRRSQCKHEYKHRREASCKCFECGYDDSIYIQKKALVTKYHFKVKGGFKYVLICHSQYLSNLKTK